MHQTLSVRCPKCSSNIRFDAAQAGTEITCETCSKSFVIERRKKKSSQKAAQNQKTNASTFGRFELHDIVGQGAFGRVYRAFDPRLERFVALKIPIFATSDQQRVARFLDEAKTAGRLRHPNIVPTFESGKHQEQLFIASQFIDGDTLTQHVQTHDAPIEQVALWIETVANALHYAHETGVIHRDIKPDNIMIDADGQPQIMDFGLAKRMDRPNQTRAGKIIGTPAYMSPEQARGEVAVSAASDQYSLGAVFYELLTGQRPFTGDHLAVIAHVADDGKEPASPRVINPTIPT